MKQENKLFDFSSKMDNFKPKSYIVYVSLPFYSQRTALHWAASYGNMEHVKMLIKQVSNKETVRWSRHFLLWKIIDLIHTSLKLYLVVYDENKNIWEILGQLVFS